MSPPTWENTPHLGAGSRYGPTPADGGADRPPPATAPPAQEQHWPSTPDRGDHPWPVPPSSPTVPLDLAGSSTSTLVTLPEVLTVREAAAILRVGRNQLYQAVTRGELGAVRIGPASASPNKPYWTCSPPPDPRPPAAMSSGGSLQRKCVKGHPKAASRCSGRCIRWYPRLELPRGPDGTRRWVRVGEAFPPLLVLVASRAVCLRHASRKDRPRSRRASQSTRIALGPMPCSRRTSDSLTSVRCSRRV